MNKITKTKESKKMKIVNKLIIITVLFSSSIKAQDSTKVKTSHWMISSAVMVPFDYKTQYTMPKCESYFSFYKYEHLLNYSLEFAYKLRIRNSKFLITPGIGIGDFRNVFYTDSMLYWRTYMTFPLKTKRVVYQDIVMYPFIDIYYSFHKKLSWILGIKKVIVGSEFSKSYYWNGDKINLWEGPIFGFYGSFLFNTGLYFRFHKKVAVSFEILSVDYFSFPDSFEMSFKLSYNLN